MMDSMASMATSLNNAQLMMDYSIAMTKKAMETQEQVATGLVTMMSQPVATLGQYIDVYA